MMVTESIIKYNPKLQIIGNFLSFLNISSLRQNIFNSVIEIDERYMPIYDIAFNDDRMLKLMGEALNAFDNYDQDSKKSHCVMHKGFNRA